MTQKLALCFLASAALWAACLPVPARSISGAGSGLFPEVSTVDIANKDGSPPAEEVAKTLNYTLVSLDGDGHGRETARYLVTVQALRQDAAQSLPSSSIAEHYTLVGGDDGACKAKSEQMLLCTLPANGRAGFSVQVVTREGWLPSGLLQTIELESPILEAVEWALPLQPSLILSESDAFIRPVLSPIQLTAPPELVCGAGKSVTSACGSVRRRADLNLYIGSAALGHYEDKVTKWTFELKPLGGDIKAWLSRKPSCAPPDDAPEDASYTRLDLSAAEFTATGRALHVCGDGASGRVELSSLVSVVVAYRPRPSNPEASTGDVYDCPDDPTLCDDEARQHGCCFPVQIRSRPDVITFPPLVARVNQLGDLRHSEDDLRADFSLQTLDCYNRPLAALPLELHVPGLRIDAPEGPTHLTDAEGLLEVSASVEMKHDPYELSAVIDQSFSCTFNLNHGS